MYFTQRPIFEYSLSGVGNLHLQSIAYMLKKVDSIKFPGK